MSQTGTWGDGFILSAAVTLYNRPIAVMSRNDESFILDGPDHPPSAEPINLLYSGMTSSSKEQNHYQALVLKVWFSFWLALML
jgi:hypothetical protein